MVSADLASGNSKKHLKEPMVPRCSYCGIRGCVPTGLGLVTPPSAPQVDCLSSLKARTCLSYSPLCRQTLKLSMAHAY